MKKMLLVLGMSFVLGSSYAQFDLSTDVVAFAFERYRIVGEKSLSENASVALDLGFATRNFGQSNESILGSNIDYGEFNFIPNYKYFLSTEKGNDGLYGGFYAHYRSSNATDVPFLSMEDGLTNKSDISSSSVGLGLQTGYKWVSTNGFVVEGYAGIGKMMVNNVTSSNSLVTDLDYEFDQFTPTFGNKVALDLFVGLKLGYRFGMN